MRLILLAALLAAQSCERTPVPPQPGAATCETACANREKVFSAQEPRCVPDCADVVKAYSELDRVYPLACQTGATTKTEFQACK